MTLTDENSKGRGTYLREATRNLYKLLHQMRTVNLHKMYQMRTVNLHKKSLVVAFLVVTGVSDDLENMHQQLPNG